MAETDEFVDDGAREGDEETWDQAERNRRAIERLAEELSRDGVISDDEYHRIEGVLRGANR